MMGIRPKTLPAAIIPVTHAYILAIYQTKSASFPLFILCLLIGFCIQAAVNLFNDAYDSLRGADTKKRIGPKRLCQLEGVDPKVVIQMAQVFCAIALIASFPLIWIRGAIYAVFILLAVFFSYAYTGGKYPLAYLGLGDLFVFLFFGLMAYLGTYYAVTGILTSLAFVAALQCGCLATILLAVNNLRDREEDEQSRKKTLAVLFGREWVEYEILFCIIVSFSLLLYWIVSPFSMSGALPWLLFPVYLTLFRSIQNTPPSAEYNRFLFMSSILYFSFAFLQIVGLVFS